MAKHKVAILVGSLRRESINRKVAKSVCAFSPDTLDCTLVEIGDLPHYNEDEERNASPAVTRFRSGILGAAGVLFCTPEYNRGVPGVLKNAIDVGSRPYGQSLWDKMPAAILSASPGAIGGFGANHQLRQACVFLNMPVMQQPETYLSKVSQDSFDEDGLLRPGPVKDIVVQAATAFADWVDVIVRARQLLSEDAAHISATAK